MKNLKYLGRSGVIKFDGFKIAWVSGNYSRPSYEETKRRRKFYHFTHEDINRVLVQKIRN